jgi:hypothetical protein
MLWLRLHRHWLARACIALGALALFACSGPKPDRSAVARISSPIAYGSPDTAHTAVVAVLAPVGTTELQECTGSIVQVTGSTGYVLTAAHCCNMYIPTVVVAATDYTVGETYLCGGTPVPPVYSVVPESVYHDARYADPGTDYDFCMLKFSGATKEMATLALPSSTSDGLQVGSAAEHLGYGETESSTTSSVRRTGTDAVTALTPTAVTFDQGGPTHIPGTCDGDSGGPALVPAGAPEAQQVIVAVDSYGNPTTCAAETLGVGSRVLSEVGMGGFITSYLANAPTGVQAGVAPAPAPAVPRRALVSIFVGLLLAGVAAVNGKGTPRGLIGDVTDTTQMPRANVISYVIFRK